MKIRVRGRVKLATDIMDLLVRKRMLFDEDWKKLIEDILNKKYQDNKFYNLDTKIQ